VRRWFESLPLDRKLITMMLAVSTAAVVVAVIGLVAFDIGRYRAAAAEDAHALAQVIAENTAAAIVFNDAEAAGKILNSMSVRPVVSCACIYRVDGSLLASYRRTPETVCPRQPGNRHGWRVVTSQVAVARNDSLVGTVFVERTLSDLGSTMLITAAAGVLALLFAGVMALVLAQRLQGVISRPIVALAHAARAIGRDARYEMPPIPSAADETGELVRAFGDMVQKLVSSNKALQAEVEERRRMQIEREGLLVREREASRLKDEFLAAVSHELRTPLNAILGWTQILGSTTPDDKTIAKAVASLSRNAQAQNRVIEDLLDVSKIITGKLQLDLQAVDLRLVVESSMEVIAPIATAKHIHLDADVPAVACMVHADFDRSRQIVWNLLSNAVKFTPPGGSVTLRLSISPDSYAIAVTDTGIGIAPAFLPHVFERFRQADGTTTREHGGLGLGLAIVKELTELQGGSVAVSSGGRGAGATFTVTFPQQVRSARTAPEAVDTVDPVVPLDGISVLAVDDNADALEIITMALTDAGATVRTAASGPEAIELWRRAPSDIVLCDLAMPQMDGFQVLKQIRQLDAATGRTTPVIAVSAYASDEYRDRCLRAGFQAHLAKPNKPADLIRAIAAALAKA
jgi:signal transduction histidine kinase/CheY-like chemotaxis protein